MVHADLIPLVFSESTHFNQAVVDSTGLKGYPVGERGREREERRGEGRGKKGEGKGEREREGRKERKREGVVEREGEEERERKTSNPILVYIIGKY